MMQKKQRKSREQKKQRTRGSTMVEVIVAFAVLAIVLACFAEITSLCLQMVQKSSNARMRDAGLYAAYYADNNGADGTTQYSGGLVFESEDSASFTLNVDLRAKEYSVQDATGNTISENLYYFYVSP